MAKYWVKDREGLVIGPLSAQALRDIAPQAKLTAASQASADGKTWLPLGDFAELAREILGASPADRLERDREEAQRILMLLDRYTELETHELFSALKGAPARDHRPGFLALGKLYHPGRLPKDAAPELVRASMEMFQFLTTRMAELEASERLHPPAPAAAAAPRPSVPTPLPRGPAPRAPALPAPPAATSPPPPQFEVQRGDRGAYKISLAVSAQNLPLFFEHKLVNVGTQSVFFPTKDVLPLRTPIDLEIRFEKETLKVRGVVVVESGQNTGPKEVKGFGVRLERISADDWTRLKAKLSELQPPQKRRS